MFTYAKWQQSSSIRINGNSYSNLFLFAFVCFKYFIEILNITNIIRHYVKKNNVYTEG